MENKLIFTQMPLIMAEVGSIKKDRKNQAQGYVFRGIDDAYNALNPVLAKYGVFSTSKILAERTEEKTSKNGSILIYRILTIEYTFWAKDGSFVKTETIGEGMDNGDKASNKAQSVAHKYALLQIFSIPTEELKDPENDSHEIVANTPKSTENINSNPNGLVFWKNKINECKNGYDLEKTAGQIAVDKTLSKEQVTELRNLYSEQLKKLTNKGAN